MKNVCILILLLLITTCGYGQQHFRFKYKFESLLNNPNLEFQKVHKTLKPYPKITATVPNKKGDMVTRNLKGIITKTNKITGDRSKKDTIYVRLWPIKDKINVGSPSSLNRNDNFQDFIFEIKKWDVHGKYSSFKIPFASTQLFAVNIPLRVGLRNGEVGSDFINANISLSRIWGNTRIYKTEFVKPRTSYLGLGGFGGLGTTKNKLDEDEVGFFYGANIIGSKYNVNLIATIGFETGVSKNGRTRPYFGFGFGFDLFSLTTSGMSDSEE